jgi:hypothetical protein
LLLLWLILPSIVAAWLLGLQGQGQRLEKAERRSQMTLIVLVGIVAAGAVWFRATVGMGLAQSSALFIGVPALLATAAVFLPTSSAKGVACKAVTIGLLVSLVFLGEGVVCVLMSAPLFYLVALVIGGSIDWQKRRDNHNSRIFPLLALMAVVPMSLEGVFPLTTISRATVVSETQTVHAPADAVAAALRSEPRFDRALPRLLAKGFPRPKGVAIDGHTLRVSMRGGEMRLNGMEPRTGTLILERVVDEPGSIIWLATSDDSHMRHFLSWQSSEVEWEAVDEHRTRVTWTIRYRRDLDPAWYFGPMERFAVRLAAQYLIESVATP